MRSSERVVTHILFHLDEPQSLRRLAHVAAASPFHFSRLFRQVTGVSPTRFLFAARLNAAMRLLLTTDTSITDLCFDVGYNSLGTFVRRFTDLLGQSPCQLRRAAAQFNLSDLQRMSKLQVPASQQAELSRISLAIQIDAPCDFDGLIFVGLYRGPILHSKPLTGAFLLQRGGVAFGPVPDDVYYVLAVGLPWKSSEQEFLLNSPVMRASSARIEIRSNTVIPRLTIALRPPQGIEIPIVAPVALMAADAMAHAWRLGPHPIVPRAVDREPGHVAVSV